MKTAKEVAEALEIAFSSLGQQEKDNIKFHLKKGTRILAGRSAYNYFGRGGAG